MTNVFFKCNDLELIKRIYSKKNKEIICEYGDKRLMAICKKYNSSIDWGKMLDISINGNIDKNSFLKNSKYSFRQNLKCLIMLNLEHSITKVHCDISGILSDNSIISQTIVLYSDNLCSSYINKLLRLFISAFKNKRTYDLYIILKPINLCISISTQDLFLSNEIIKKVDAIEYLNKEFSNISKTISNSINFKKYFLDNMSNYLQVVPYSDYISSYNESYRFVSMIVFDNKILNKWLTISLINTNAHMPSSKLKISNISDKEIIFTNSLDKYIKNGFCSIDFSEISSISKCNNLIKLLLKSIENIYSEFSSEVKFFKGNGKINTNSKNKKVRFSSKLYTDSNKNSNPSFNIKKYKNGKPVGILKKKSSYK